jgi:hypothetical protein
MHIKLLYISSILMTLVLILACVSLKAKALQITLKSFHINVQAQAGIILLRNKTNLSLISQTFKK